MRRLVGLILLSTAVSCAPSPMVPPEPPPLPKDAVFFKEAPRVLFDRIVRTLQKDGYEVEADRPRLFVQTQPRELNGVSSGPLHFEGFFVVEVIPRRGGSSALIHFVVEPQLPGEREKLLKQLKPMEQPPDEEPY